jgi:hypothetical protein
LSFDAILAYVATLQAQGFESAHDTNPTFYVPSLSYLKVSDVSEMLPGLYMAIAGSAMFPVIILCFGCFGCVATRLHWDDRKSEIH